MKKLIPIMLLFLLSACETTTTWLVTTTVRLQKWNTVTVTKFYDQSTTTTELVADMSEKEIQEYYQPTNRRKKSLFSMLADVIGEQELEVSFTKEKFYKCYQYLIELTGEELS